MARRESFVFLRAALGFCLVLVACALANAERGPRWTKEEAMAFEEMNAHYRLTSLERRLRTVAEGGARRERGQRQGGNQFGEPYFGPNCPRHPAYVPFPNNTVPPELQDAFVALEANVSAALDRFNVVGAAMAVIYGQQIIWSKSFGVADKTTNAPVDLDTAFRVGSITKVFTVLMLLKLRNEGKLSLDDEVVKYFPELQFGNTYPNSRGVTFRQLASQISGLPGGEPCSLFMLGNCDISNEKAFSRFKDQDLIFMPNEMGHYADSPFALLGRALERFFDKKGEKYEDYTSRELFSALNMTHTGFDLSSPVALKYLASGYTNGTAYPPLVAKADLWWAAPTGQAFSSTLDLAKLIMFYFRGLDDRPGLLDGATLREALLPVFAYDDGFSSYGMPLEFYQTNTVQPPGANYWLRTKGGRIPGYSAMIIMIPEIKYGMVVTMNDDYAVEFGMSASDLIVPVFDSVLARLQPPPPNPGNLTEYTGVYVYQFLILPVNITYKIELTEEGQLVMYIGTFYMNVTWSGQGNRFRMLFPSGLACLMQDAGNDHVFMDFQTDPDSKRVISMTMTWSEGFYGLIFKKTS